MRLCVDLNGDSHYVMTEEGETVYVDDLQEDGRDSEYLELAISTARQRVKGTEAVHSAGDMAIETFESPDEPLD